MQILKVISLLLDYPTDTLILGNMELGQAIAAAQQISPIQRRALQTLLDQLTQTDLMDAQEAYNELFDRGRSLSLLLFEHVHGESRDRGQAMVDLMAQYEAAGFAIGVRELPDYIPLYLEYLSTREDLEAREGLADVSHLLALLAARLTERESAYAACFTSLLQIAGEIPEHAVAEVSATVKSEERDDSLAALDAQWEDEMVTFLNGDQDPSCGSQQQRDPNKHKAREEVAVPVHWVDFKQSAAPAGKA